MRKRELLGLILLLVGASGIYFSVRQAPPQYVYLTASRDISAGEVVASDDFARASLNLSNAAALYVSGDVELLGHRTLRKIARGEVVPRDAVTEVIEVEERQLITFTVEPMNFPAALTIGDVIDMYFFSIPTGSVDAEKVQLLRVLERIRVRSITKSENQIDGHVMISALFSKNDVRDVMTLIANSRITIAQRFDDNE